MLPYSAQKPCCPASARRPPGVRNESETRPPARAAASTTVTSTSGSIDSWFATDSPPQPAPITTTLRLAPCSATCIVADQRLLARGCAMPACAACHAGVCSARPTAPPNNIVGLPRTRRVHAADDACESRRVEEKRSAHWPSGEV